MSIELGFLMKPLLVSGEKILASRRHAENLAETYKYKQIRASIEEIGLIEPISIGPLDRKSGTHLLLDGHIRIAVLTELGHSEFPCLVASDDESYTYNNRINRLSSVQEHLMIKRAISRGVSAERLSKVLGMDLSGVRKRASLLDGICREAAMLLKDRHFAYAVAVILRKMKSTRQVECAELMLASNTITLPYARSLLMATSPDMLVSGKAPQAKGVTREQIDRMEREMASIRDQYKTSEDTFGEDMLNLVLAKGYITKLVDNKLVMRYLVTNQPEVMEQFASLVQTDAMDF